MARSRSSLVAGIFAYHGCWYGDPRPPDKYNRTGYFENKNIKKLIKRARPDSNSYRTILGGKKPYTTVKYEKILEAAKNAGYPGGPWLSKVDSFAWPPYPGPFVKVWREKEGIMSSIRRTPMMSKQGFTPEQWDYIIDAHHEEMRTIDGVDVDTDELIKGDHSAICAAIESYGLVYDDTITNRLIRIPA